ncbi:MAG: DUF2304 domain-containing protein [Clostridium sp.]|nr:DUF2304 domain-containing protein [Clostridium sp.]
MTFTLRVVVTVISILTTAVILKKIRKSQMQIEDSIYWIGFCLVLVVFALFPKVPDVLSGLAGTYSTANFIYMAVIFLLIVKLFRMTLTVSKLESQIRRLAQEMALERREHEREMSGEEKEHGTD